MLSIATLHAVDYYTDAATESFGYYGGNPAGGAFGSTRETDPPGYWTGTLGHRAKGQRFSARTSLRFFLASTPYPNEH